MNDATPGWVTGSEREARQPNSSDIVASLRSRIVSMGLMQDDRLPPERELARQFGVARGTVRKALHRLEDAGLVERRMGSGTYVTYSAADQTQTIIQSTSPLELVDTRFALEPQMVRLAVLNATGQDLDQLQLTMEAVENIGEDYRAFSAADEEFHLGLANCTQNSLMIWMCERVNEVRRHNQWETMKRLTLTPPEIAGYNRQHRAIFEAIVRRDAEAAAGAMQGHLQKARDALVRATKA